MRNTSSLSNCSYAMLCEMNRKAKRLCELMKKGVVYFIFKKKSTGKIRKARGTLKRDLIPAEFRRKSGRPKKRPEDLVVYYDVDKKDIRSFKDYNLQKIKPQEHPTRKLKVEDKPAETISKNPPESIKTTKRKDASDGQKEKEG